ncbi:hypothetical protein [Candidatus Methanoprimaticola sp. MG2]|uniref:hypothetical protein n=1 Tax=Candidatus Methanoprimaticola sp. MG2 TaxID=3228838 RepID=UPI0039C5B17E
MDESELQTYLRSFVCSRDLDREDFLHNKAIIFEKKSMARTYLAIMEGRIAGYYTLSIRCLRVPDDQNVAKSLSKKMNIDPDNNVAQSYLLGQLGRADYSYKGMGADLLEDAVELIKQANGIVGCRVIRVDCPDELIPYYEQHDFKYLCITDPTEDKPPINQMVQII